MAASTTAAVASHLRFALMKFRPAALPATLVTRSGLHERLTAGAGQAADGCGGGGWGGQERTAVELGGGPGTWRDFLVVLR